MKPKVVAIHQPYFMPWLGFFDKISKADIFIVLDNVECPSRNSSMLNRNKIKTPVGPKWLTIPLHINHDTQIKDALIDNSQDWRNTHLKTLQANYAKAPNYSKIVTLIKKMYAKDYQLIADLNLDLINEFLKILGIKREIYLSSNLKPGGKSNDLLINLVKAVHGKIYLSGQGAKNYMDIEKFKKAGIEIIWQDFKQPVYKQLWGEFITNLSTIDYLFCDRRPFG